MCVHADAAVLIILRAGDLLVIEECSTYLPFVGFGWFKRDRDRCNSSGASFAVNNMCEEPVHRGSLDKEIKKDVSKIE